MEIKYLDKLDERIQNMSETEQGFLILGTIWTIIFILNIVNIIL